MPTGRIKINIMRATGGVWTLKGNWNGIIDKEGSLLNDSRYSIHGNDARYFDDYLCMYTLKDDSSGETIKDVKKIKKILEAAFKANGNGDFKYEFNVS